MKASSPSIRKVDDQRLIAGYLRDTILNGYIFVIEIGPSIYSGKLVSITEPSAREKDALRTIEILVEGHPTWPEIPEGEKLELKARVAFERLLVHFSVPVLDLTGSTIIAGLPEELTLVVHREQHRFSADAIQPNVTLAKLDVDGLSFHALFQLNDVSTDGFGGFLFTQNEIHAKQNIRLTGLIQQSTGAIRIDGKIAWLEKAVDLGTNWYKIGISSKRQAAEKISQELIESLERRRNKRVTATFPIELVSPLFPETTATLHLENISMKGLKARILNMADKVLFREQLEVTLKSPRLRLRIVSVEEECLICVVLASSLEEHIRLSNLICSYSEKDIINSTAVGNDFLQIFAVSGSVSSTLAKSQALVRRTLQGGIQKTNIIAPWFLRWNQQSEEGRLRASIMVALFGDHVWYLGALAGHLDPELKMSKDFIPRFYRHLSDFLTGIGRHEYLLFNWAVQNSYWDEWEAELGSLPETDTFFRFYGDIVYFKDMPPSSEPRQETVELLPLSSASPGVVESLLQRMPSANIRNLFRALGLTQFSFGCRTLGELLEKNHHSFLRDFYYCEIGGSPCFIMLSRFPVDSSPNGVLNYPFVYFVGAMSAQELDMLSLTVLDLASNLGVYCPAFYLSTTHSPLEVRATKLVNLRDAIWTFATPEILEFWRNR